VGETIVINYYHHPTITWGLINVGPVGRQIKITAKKADDVFTAEIDWNSRKEIQ